MHLWRCSANWVNYGKLSWTKEGESDLEANYCIPFLTQISLPGSAWNEVLGFVFLQLNFFFSGFPSFSVQWGKRSVTLGSSDCKTALTYRQWKRLITRRVRRRGEGGAEGAERVLQRTRRDAPADIAATQQSNTKLVLQKCTANGWKENTEQCPEPLAWGEEENSERDDGELSEGFKSCGSFLHLPSFTP